MVSIGKVNNVTVTKHVKKHFHGANIKQLSREFVRKRKAIDDLSEIDRQLYI